MEALANIFADVNNTNYSTIGFVVLGVLAAIALLIFILRNR